MEINSQTRCLSKRNTNPLQIQRKRKTKNNEEKEIEKLSILERDLRVKNCETNKVKIR